MKYTDATPGGQKRTIPVQTLKNKLTNGLTKCRLVTNIIQYVFCLCTRKTCTFEIQIPVLFVFFNYKCT